MGDPAQGRDIEPNIIEGKAAEYVLRRNERREAEFRERTPDEVESIDRVARRAVIWASAAGLISGALIGATELVVMREVLEGQEDADFWEQLPAWAAFMGLAGIVSVAEILFLYWAGLQATVQVSRLAGLALVEGRDGRPGLVTRGLGRAALELPNPHAPVYGIDPFARTSRWKIYAWMLVYRAKVGMSSLVVRVLLRRVLGRAALRFLVPLVAGPLYAVWNGIITWRIMREVRLRAFGPMAVEATVKQIADDLAEADEKTRVLAVAAVGECIIRSQDDHPNFVLLVGRLLDALELSPDQIEVDWAAQRDRLSELTGRERDAVLRAMLLTSILDWRIRRSEKELLEDAHRSAGRSFDEAAFGRLRERLLEGRAPREDQFEAVWG